MQISIIDRARRYIAQMATSLQGANGSAAIFAAAVVLIRGFHLSHQEALVLLREWNESKAIPLWSERELIAKLESAAKDGKMAYGHLLNDDDRGRTKGSTSKAPASLTEAPAARMGYAAADLRRAAAVLHSAPKLRHLILLECGKLAYLRNLPLAAVDIACQNRRVAMDDSRPDCYVLTDGRGFRQYRRWDGQSFRHRGKSDNLKGSLAKGFLTLGNRKLDPDDVVFLLEGAIGLLELEAIQWLCAPHARRWYMVAAHSAASTFAADPELLNAIAGHHVRIMPDHNETGKKAAKAWRDEVRAVGCSFDFAAMPPGFQDLKVILAAGTDGLSAARSILAYPTLFKSGGAN